jgi:hypothetical protein
MENFGYNQNSFSFMIRYCSNGIFKIFSISFGNRIDGSIGKIDFLYMIGNMDLHIDVCA